MKAKTQSDKTEKNCLAVRIYIIIACDYCPQEEYFVEVLYTSLHCFIAFICKYVCKHTSQQTLHTYTGEPV